ncbi:hypothetical protein [Streptomyces virginiae]|uniref:hypothetical protein n=1 Tax=Streptomyces virginiae TaxID=1961 RepID=UPI003681EE65
MAGTLASALLTQRGASRVKERELEHADRQRLDDRIHAQQARRHQERCDSYAEFITLTGTLHSQIYELRSPSQGDDSYRVAYEQARSDRAALLRQAHRILLEGPKTVSDEALELYGAMNLWMSVANDVYKAEAAGNSSQVDAKRRRFLEIRDRCKRSRSAFVREAQKVINQA